MRLAILTFTLFLCGCVTVPTDGYVNVKWHRTNDAYAEARKLRLNVTPEHASINGFKYFDGNVCHVFAPDPKVEVKDGKRTYRTCQWGTLGHEVKHCFDGSFHDKKDNSWHQSTKQLEKESTMASVNRVILIGNLGKDPETRYMPSGEAVTNISIATTETWKDKKSGEKQEHTEWHRISFFGRLAEVAGEYLQKGSPIYVEGRIRTRKWKDKDDNDRYSTEIVGDRLQMLGSRQSEESGAGTGGGKSASDYSKAKDGERGSGKAPAKKSGGSFDDMDDDIPF